jgi:hypothetical protein
MKNKIRVTAILAVLLATLPAAADTTLVSGDARGRAILDVLEGRAGMVAISGSYDEAIAAARRQALLDGKRFTSSSTLHYQPVSRTYGAPERIGVVTLGMPSSEAQREIARLRSPEAAPMVAGR